MAESVGGSDLLNGWRLVPPAVTPLRVSDLLGGYVERLRGRGLDEFKNALVASLGATEAVTFTSFRRAIYACLLEVRAQVDDDRTGVLIPAYSCPDFYSAIRGAGLDVQCCDLHPRTLTIDVESAAEATDANTFAMVAVNHLGFANRMDQLADFCADNDLVLIEDLGYSLGVTFDDEQLGTFGDWSVLNFREGKAIPVGGGMLTTNRESLTVIDSDRAQTTPNPVILTGYKLFAQPYPYRIYQDASDRLRQAGVIDARVSSNTQTQKEIDYSLPLFTMSDFQGAIGRRILTRVDEHRRQRAETARYYASELANCDTIQTIAPVSGVANVQYIRYPILVNDDVSRTTVRSALRSAGVKTAALYQALDIDSDRYPNSERVRRDIITLPTHPYVTAADRRRVIDAISTVVC